jgi:hypothetical protein
MLEIKFYVLRGKTHELLKFLYHKMTLNL